MGEAKFVEGNLFRHVVVMSLTASVGLMSIFIVDLINLVYVSWLRDPVLTAAVGYAGVVLFFSSAVGIGLSIGVSALVARALGARDLAEARARATSGLVVSTLLGVAFSVLVFLLLEPVVAALGARGRVAEETLKFLRLVTVSQPLLVVTMVGAAVLRAHGAARRAMMITVWGAMVLAALDPLFILGLEFGLSGAAIATWGSRSAMVAMALWPLWRMGALAPLRGIRPWRGAGALVAISVPAILTQMATPVGQAIVTRMVARFGEAAVSGMAIAGRLTPVAFAMLFSMAGALGPIIGQNLGAGRMDRVKRAFRDAILFSGIVILAMSLLLYLLRPWIADMFHATGTARDLVYLFCGPLSLLFFFNGLVFASNAACNNLGAAMQSTMVNWGRHTIGTWPFAWWFMQGHLGPGGAAGVLIGQAMGGIVFGLIAVWLVLRVIARHPVTRRMAAPAAPAASELR